MRDRLPVGGDSADSYSATERPVAGQILSTTREDATARYVSVAAAFLATGIAAGAFGSHALRGMVEPQLLAVFEKGVLYHLTNSAALLAISHSPAAALAAHLPSTSASDRRNAGSAFRRTFLLVTWGIVLFSGSLYALVITGWRALGIVTPFGGISLILGWALLAWNTGKSYSGRPG